MKYFFSPFSVCSSAIKDAIRNFKMTNKVAGMSHSDLEAFKKAGVGPLKKTYKYDPTKDF